MATPHRRLGRILDELSPAAIHTAGAVGDGGRLSAWPLGDPLVYTGALPGATEPGISPEEASFFKENGFIVKRGLLSRESLRPGREVFWRNAPACIDPDDSSTWVNPVRPMAWRCLPAWCLTSNSHCGGPPLRCL